MKQIVEFNMTQVVISCVMHRSINYSVASLVVKKLNTEAFVAVIMSSLHKKQ